MKRWIVAGLAATVVGCGGGDDASTTEAVNVAPEPQQPVDDLLPALEQAGADADCVPALELVHRVQLPEADGGESPANCRSALKQLRFLRDFEPTDALALGTAAVVDGTIDGDEIAITLALDQDGTFRWVGITNPRHEIGTEPPAEVDYERPAAAFVEALRDGDCKAAHAQVAPTARLAYADEKEFCSVFEENYMTEPEGVGARLRADPDAELIDFGGTRDLYFFGLATEPAGYRTVLVSDSTEGPKVYDAVPVER